jgi:hypothetical protein
MASAGLKGLLIRTGSVRRGDLGYLLAGDPAKEEAEEPHVIIITWKAGSIKKSNAKHNANSSCIIEDPQSGILISSPSGAYSLTTKAGAAASNIFDNSHPAPKVERFGDIRSVRSVAGKAYAVGGTGWAFRLDKLAGWTLIDGALPTTFDIESIDGFGHADLYAAGYRGEVWHFDDRLWSKCETPTNANLNVVRCAENGAVYAAGRGGFLMRGDGTSWEVLDHDATTDDIWDLAWFNGSLYVSTLAALYRLDGGNLVAVKFGSNAPKSFYHLSVAPGVMWSIGARDVMSFDGKRWTRVI